VPFPWTEHFKVDKKITEKSRSYKSMAKKFFDDLQVGEKEKTVGRTITEADLVNFAGLSGDFNAVHMDKEFAKNTFFGKRIAHGILVFAVASGLFTQSRMNISIKENVLALMEINWKFLKPVFIGDTIHLEVEIMEKKETSKSDRGVAIKRRTVVNQNGDIVQQGDVALMVRRKV